VKDAQLVASEELASEPKRFLHEKLSMPDGYVIDWYYMDVPPSVMIVPVTPEGDVVLVRQYRYNLRKYTLELPAGTVGKGESPEEAAERELREETGYAVSGIDRLIPLGKFYSLPSETNKDISFFLATPVEKVGPALYDNQIERYFDMSIEVMPLATSFTSIGRQISGIETAAALMLAQSHLPPRKP
jgi:8-oxo-dGTP pyrophosphatase MutT (NUDIX family)